MKPVKPEWHNEDRVEAAMRCWLESRGWQVHPRSTHSGVDISALDSSGVPWLLEVKGYPSTYKKRDGVIKSRASRSSQRRVWFVEALGQILSRMRKPGFQYALVFPDHPTDKYFEEQACKLPRHLREALNLWLILVSEPGMLKVLAPKSDEFKEWSNGASQ